MGLRAHICDKHEQTFHSGEGCLKGYTLEVEYSPKQTVWMNNRRWELYNWIINYLEDGYCVGDEGDSYEWEMLKSELEAIPEEAYDEWTDTSISKEDVKQFIAECIAANPTSDTVYIEWF